MSDERPEDNESSNCPEPPLKWSSSSEQPGGISRDGNLSELEGDAIDLDGVRKLVSGSQVAAIVSLFIGGVVLSAVAIGLAAYGYRQLSAAVQMHKYDQNVVAALKRSCMIAIAVAVVALAVNAVMVAWYFPTYIETLQQAGLYGQPGTALVAPASPNAGSSLFG